MKDRIGLRDKMVVTVQGGLMYLRVRCRYRGLMLKLRVEVGSVYELYVYARDGVGGLTDSYVRYRVENVDGTVHVHHVETTHLLWVVESYGNGCYGVTANWSVDWVPEVVLV
jgi:hypothetical protein